MYECILKQILNTMMPALLYNVYFTETLRVFTTFSHCV